MKLETIPVDKVLVGERARTELGDIDVLADAIKEKGLIQPITVDTNYNLIAGGRRLAASKLAGLAEIPAVIRETGGKLDSWEVELMENISRKDMTWQERAKLEQRIHEYKKETEDKWSVRKQAAETNTVPSQVHRRIQLAEAMELLPELEKCSNENEAWKRYKRLEEDFVVSVLHERAAPEIKQESDWAEKSFIVGDAFEGMAGFEDDVFDFAEVDPPYGVSLDDRKSRNKTESHKMEGYNEIDESEYPAFMERVASEVYRILKPNAFAVFWYGMSWHKETLEIIRAAGFNTPDIPAIWYKGKVGQTAQPDLTFGSCYEPFFLARKGVPRLARSGRSNTFVFDMITPSKKIHPTEKPVDMLVELFSTILLPGSKVVVPFLGSGASLNALHKLGHIGLGWDLTKGHKEAFLARIRREIINNADM